ncbi:MAG: hypothetical protein ACRD0W_07775 [Acidimicrobiales bacterium]
MGALAAAIAAILSFLPDSNPDPEDIARVTSVRIAPQTPLSEYEQRAATIVPGSLQGSQAPQPNHEASAQIAGLLQAGPTTSDPAVSGTDTSAPGTSSSDTTVSSSTTSSSTSSSALSTASSASSTTSAPSTSDVEILSRTMPFAILPRLQEVDPPERVNRVLADAAAKDPTLRHYLSNATGLAAMKAMALGNSITAEGDVVAPEDAAEQLVALLRSARRTGTQEPGGELPGGEPLGVVVTADIELIGLRNRPVMLSWEMWQQGGHVRLYGEWLNTNLAYLLEATTDHDTTSVDLWIPLPQGPGPYFIRLLLAAEQSALASADSESFT